MCSKSGLLLIVVLAIVKISLCNISCLKYSENISKVLPKIWSSLAWNKVTLLESSRNCYTLYKNLISESSKQNINLKISFFEKVKNKKEFLEKSFFSKMTFILRRNDDLQDFGFLIKSRKPISTVIAVANGQLSENIEIFLKYFNETTSMYLLNVEK